MSHPSGIRKISQTRHPSIEYAVPTSNLAYGVSRIVAHHVRIITTAERISRKRIAAELRGCCQCVTSRRAALNASAASMTHSHSDGSARRVTHTEPSLSAAGVLHELIAAGGGRMLLPVSRLGDVPQAALDGADVIGIDEGSFFPDLLAFCDAQANAGKEVIVASLDGDFQRKP